MADSVDYQDDAEDAREATNDSVRMSDLSDDQAILRFKAWFRDDDSHASDWLEEAKEDFRFVAGDQFTDEEKAVLRRQQRPDIVFNRLATMVRSVAGYQVNQRLATYVKPREQADEQSVEVGNALIRWFRDQSDAQFADGDAFQDTVTCGMGWVDMRLDYEDDPMGAPHAKRMNPLNMRWDHRARERNLKDARRVWEILEDIPLSEAKEMFPDADDHDLNASWALDHATGDAPEDQDEADLYRGDDDANEGGQEKLVTIVRCQWWEREDYFRVIDPFSGQITEMSVEDYNAAMKRFQAVGMPFKGIKQRRKVYKQAFLGRTVLESGPAPCKHHFSMQCITGFRDEIKGTFHGLVTGLKDPQRWANKWMSQTLHILNSTAKGGIMVEKGAVENMRKFEASWPRNEAVTEVGSGALVEGRIQPKPTTPFPAGFYQLMEMAVNAMRDVSGVNLEMLGQRDANQPGVVETQRRSAALTTLTVLFECMRMYRRVQGELILALIKDYLPEQVLARVLGPQLQQILPNFMASDAKYDIVVDEAPDSPNAKDVIWSTMGQTIHQQPPQVQAVLWKYSPLPGSAVSEMQQAIQAAMSPPPPPPPDPNQIAAMQAQQQSEQAKMQADTQKAQMDVEAKRVDLAAKDLELQMKQLDLAIAQEQARAAGAKAAADQMQAQYKAAQVAFNTPENTGQA